MLGPELFQLIAGILVVFFIFYGLEKRFPPVKFVLLLGGYIYVVALLSIKLFPIFIDAPPVYSYNEFLPLAYLAQLAGANSLGRFIIRQCILLIPFGFFLPLWVKKLDSYWYALGYGLMAFFGIEALRFGIGLYIGHRYTDFILDELFPYTIAAFIGYIAWRIARPTVIHLTTRRAKDDITVEDGRAE